MEGKSTSASRSFKTEAVKQDRDTFTVEKVQSMIIKRYPCSMYDNPTSRANRQFAYSCVDVLVAQDNFEAGTIESGIHFDKAIVNDYSLKLTKRGYFAKTVVTLKTTVPESSSFLGDICKNRIAYILSSLSSERSASMEPKLYNGVSSEWKQLYHFWETFTSSFRKQAFPNLKLIFIGRNGERVKIQSNNVKATILVFMNDKNQEEIMFRVNVINKRTLGRLILLLIGNEGAQQTTEQAGLTRLLQAFITKLEGDEVKEFNDVKLSLYGQDCTSFHILAGKVPAKKQIVGYVDFKGEFHINEKYTSNCTLS